MQNSSVYTRATSKNRKGPLLSFGGEGRAIASFVIALVTALVFLIPAADDDKMVLSPGRKLGTSEAEGAFHFIFFTGKH